jgi:ERCC4-type nuclease
MEIILDCRELKLCAIMPDVKTAQLIIGDIWIKRKNTAEEDINLILRSSPIPSPMPSPSPIPMPSPMPIKKITLKKNKESAPLTQTIQELYKPSSQEEIIAIIERKTWSDLYSSILDGRYTEQKARAKTVINANGTRPRLIYIIEGRCTNNATICKSACVSMALDNFALLYSDNVADTKEIILKISTKISKKNTDVSINYESLIKPCKKDNMTAEICYIQQLSCIPGLSITIAKEISTKWKNMKELITEIEIYGSKNIEEIKINNRRISKTVAQKLTEYLL